jgi:hypothetical protein
MFNPLSLLCLWLPGLLLCLPALGFVAWWFLRGRGSSPDHSDPDEDGDEPRRHRFPLTAVGAALMGLSFVTLPWLSLKPLERIGLDWLHDVVPFAGGLLTFFHIDSLDRLLPFWRIIGIRPPGWLALLLNAQTWGGLFWLGLEAVVVGGLVYLLAHWVAAAPRKPRLSAPVLVATAAVLLLLLLYRLPTIDGLGEHDFSNLLPLVLPIVFNIHMSSVGPLVMVVGLVLLLVGGILRAQE